MDHLLHLQRQKIRDVCSKEKSNLARDNKQEIPIFHEMENDLIK